MPTACILTTHVGQRVQPLTVPDSWHEVTLAQLAACQGSPTHATVPQPLEVLAGLPAGSLPRLAAAQVHWLAQHLAFAADVEAGLGEVPSGQPDPGACSYGALLLAQQYLQAAEEATAWPQVGPYLLALYRVERTWGSADEARVAACHAALLAAPVTEAGAACRAIVAQLGELLERHQPPPQDELELTDAEWAAGSEDLAERFAGLLNLDAAAGGQLTAYEAALKQDAATVLLKLSLEGARAAFARRVQQYHEAETGHA